MSAIFLLPIYSSPTDVESVSRVAYPMLKTSTKFEVDMTTRCLFIAFWLLIRYVTLWPWPLTFDLGHWSYMTVHVVNLHNQFEDPPTIRSWVMSFDISRMIPLIMRLQPLRMRRITWPMRRGKFFSHISNPWPRFTCSLYNFYSAIRWRLRTV